MRRAAWVTPWGLLPVLAGLVAARQYAAWSNGCGYAGDGGAGFAILGVLLAGTVVGLGVSAALGMVTRGEPGWFRLGLLVLMLVAVALSLPMVFGAGGSCP